MGKNIALLTAGHLSSCPRLIKEAKLLSSNGYEVNVVYLESIPRITKLDRSIVAENPSWKFYPIQWGNDMNGTLSKIYYRLSNLLSFNNVFIQSTSKSLIDQTIAIKADLYIAHHPSVLVAAALAAKKYNAKYAYDIEDAFPYVEDNSYLDNPNSIIDAIENNYIKNTAFTTTASPLYSEIYMHNYKLLKMPINLLNVFEIDNSPIEYLDRKDLQKVSFYWYSQTVGLNRGLQDLFRAINRLPENSFELHIRGTVEEEVKNELLSIVNVSAHLQNIYFHNSVSMHELTHRNREHDIGFALETSSNLNKDLCISNKILDYLRSGLMIVATNTSGHQYITKELDGNCISYHENDIDTLSDALNYYINNKDLILKSKHKSLQLAIEKYNWDLQSKNYLNTIVNELY